MPIRRHRTRNSQYKPQQMLSCLEQLTASGCCVQPGVPLGPTALHHAQRLLPQSLRPLEPCVCRRWVDQHGDQARQLQHLQDARQQAEDRAEQLSTQLKQEQQQVAQQKDRCGLLPRVLWECHMQSRLCLWQHSSNTLLLSNCQATTAVAHFVTGSQLN